MPAHLPNYNYLIDTFIKDILESGLLLDEDLEILISLYSLDSPPQVKTYKPSFKLTASFSSLLISLPLAKKLESNWIAVPSLLMIIATTAMEIKCFRDEKNQISLIKNLVKILKKIHALDISVKRYMKTRLEVGKKCDHDFLMAQGKGINDFFRKTIEDEFDNFTNCMNSLKSLVAFSDDLLDDYNHIKNFIPLNQEEPIPVNPEESVSFSTRVQDLHIWLSSKLLNYIGILFCSDCKKLDENALKELLTVQFPSLLEHLQRYYEARRKSFQSLRYSVNKCSEYKTKKKMEPAKLQNTLESVVDNLSIISEKSVKLLETIESNGVKGDANTLMLDLRNHTYSAYESLDLLCRLYSILSNSPNTNLPKADPLPVKHDEVEAKNIPVIHHDDTIEPLEENYELFVDADDHPDPAEDQLKKIPEDQSGVYLSLMLQELKQSIKQHERFIEARKKRGMQDEEEEEQKPEKRSKSPPRFDLNVLSGMSSRKGESPAEEVEDSTIIRHEGEISPPNKAVPPPPPLPTFDLGNLEEESLTNYNPRAMLDNIKALSSQLGREEEVFVISD